jgi:transposase-like protein
MNPRYTRVRDMITDDAVPRLQSGGVALCHICQRSVHFAGGFLQKLLQVLEYSILRSKPAGHCPRCGSAKLYLIRRYARLRCSGCRHEWTPNSHTERSRAKKPKAWYDQITELHRAGTNPHQIGKIMGAGDTKSIARFVAQLQAFENLEMSQ